MKRFIAICTYAPSTHLSPSIWICQTPSIPTIHICMGAWDVPFTPRTLSYTPKSEGEREGFRLSSFWCKWQLLIQMQSSGYIRLQTHGVFVCLDSCKSKLSIQMQSFKTAKYEVTAHCKKNSSLFGVVLFLIFSLSFFIAAYMLYSHGIEYSF